MCIRDRHIIIVVCEILINFAINDLSLSLTTANVTLKIMYESFLPDFNSATIFYKNNADKNLSQLFLENAERYFKDNNVEYTLDKDSNSVRFSTSKGMFMLSFRNNVPSAFTVYSISNSFIKEFRDSIWRTKKVFGFPVGAVLDLSLIHI